MSSDEQFSLDQDVAFHFFGDDDTDMVLRLDGPMETPVWPETVDWVPDYVVVAIEIMGLATGGYTVPTDIIHCWVLDNGDIVFEDPALGVDNEQ